MDPKPGPLLVVEDVPDTLALVELTLKFKGYRVITATNGQEALEAIKKERPSVIITDILMPRMDGFSLVHQLRIDPDTRDIPVIFLSATYVSLEDKTFAIAIGVTEFIEKPIDIEDLLRAIEELQAQRMPTVHEPLEERAFYEGYYQRLGMKLQQKISQIARIEGMLETLSDKEKQAFEVSRQNVIQERDDIQRLIDQIHARLAGFDKPK